MYDIPSIMKCFPRNCRSIAMEVWSLQAFLLLSQRWEFRESNCLAPAPNKLSASWLGNLPQKPRGKAGLATRPAALTRVCNYSAPPRKFLFLLKICCPFIVAS